MRGIDDRVKGVSGVASFIHGLPPPPPLPLLYLIRHQSLCPSLSLSLSLVLCLFLHFPLSFLVYDWKSVVVLVKAKRKITKRSFLFGSVWEGERPGTRLVLELLHRILPAVPPRISRVISRFSHPPLVFPLTPLSSQLLRFALFLSSVGQMFLAPRFGWFRLGSLGHMTCCFLPFAGCRNLGFISHLIYIILQDGGRLSGISGIQLCLWRFPWKVLTFMDFVGFFRWFCSWVSFFYDFLERCGIYLY